MAPPRQRSQIRGVPRRPDAFISSMTASGFMAARTFFNAAWCNTPAAAPASLLPVPRATSSGGRKPFFPGAPRDDADPPQGREGAYCSFHVSRIPVRQGAPTTQAVVEGTD